MTLLICGILIIFALVVGHFEGYLMGVKVRNVTSLFTPTEKVLDPRKCVCGHEHSTHLDKGAGKCNCLNNERDKFGDRYSCACRVYIPNTADKRFELPKGELQL